MVGRRDWDFRFGNDNKREFSLVILGRITGSEKAKGFNLVR